MDLKQRAIKSTAWYGATRLWTQLVSWGVTILLARLLTPADYGVFAMALSVIAFFELFQEFGLGVAIVQRQDLTRQQVNAVFWIVMGASSTLLILGWLGAGTAAWFYGDPRLVWMVRLLALTFVLHALGLVPYSLLTKEIDFRRRSAAEAASVLVAATVSVALAWLGYGVWALVIGHVVRSVIRNGMMMAVCGWYPGLAVSGADVRSIVTFGLHVAGSSVVSTVAGVARTAIQGRVLGGTALGLLSMGHSLGIDSAHKLYTSVLNQLSLPVFSKLQTNDAELRRYFMKLTRYLAVVCLPVQVGTAVVAHDMVALLLSEQWRPVVPLLQVFALCGMWYVLPLPSAPVLTARGKADRVFRFTTVSATLSLLGTLIGVQFGLVGVMTAWVLTYPTMRLYLLWMSLVEIGLSVRAYLVALAPTLLGTVAMVVAVSLVRRILPDYDMVVHRLVRDVGVGALAYGATVLAMDRRFGSEVRGIVQELRAPSRA